jgi:Transposase zinc-binding domain/Putative transposase
MPAACLNRAAESLRLAQVLRGALPRYPWRLSPHQWKVLNAILRCRTPELGGHLYHCADCGGGHFIPHSCRNRHCPQCQKAQCIQWLEKQSQALLPVPYFHVVFTLPHDLNALIAQNQTALYNLLFAAASATLLKFGEHRLKAQIGVTAVLHTWSQTLLDHYHLHCVVTGGGLGARGWKRASEHYLFPVKALSKVFKAKFLQGLRELDCAGKLAFHGSLEALREKAGFAALLARAARSEWVV